MRLPASLTFRDAPSRDVFTALARFANINVTFDPQFRDPACHDRSARNDARHALQALSAATRSFYRVTGPRFITVVPDTAAKRQEYEEEIVRTFPLSNADLKETVDLLRIVIDARRLAPVTATNTIAIKDTPARVAAAGKLIAAIDKARPEVVIDVELLEIDRTRLKEYGLQIASPTANSTSGPTGIDGQVDVNRPDLTLRDLRSLTQSDVFLTNVPALFYRLLKQDTNTRILANPQLRTSEGMPAQARFGERVPVPVTTFSPIATGGISQQPITSFNYENIGVNIDITPRTHHDDEVSLALKLEVEQHLRCRVRRVADVRQPLRQHRDSPARRRDESAGRSHPRRRAACALGDRRVERPAAGRPSLCPQPQGNPRDRHRAHADAAHRPRARSERRRSAAIPRRPRRRHRRSWSGVVPLPLPVELPPRRHAARAAGAAAATSATTGAARQYRHDAYSSADRTAPDAGEVGRVLRPAVS